MGRGWSVPLAIGLVVTAGPALAGFGRRARRPLCPLRPRAPGLARGDEAADGSPGPPRRASTSSPGGGAGPEGWATIDASLKDAGPAIRRAAVTAFAGTAGTESLGASLAIARANFDPRVEAAALHAVERISKGAIEWRRFEPLAPDGGDASEGPKEPATR